MISARRRSDAGHAPCRPGGGGEGVAAQPLHFRASMPSTLNDSEVSVKMKECVTHAVATRRYALALCF